MPSGFIDITSELLKSPGRIIELISELFAMHAACGLNRKDCPLPTVWISDYIKINKTLIGIGPLAVELLKRNIKGR